MGATVVERKYFPLMRAKQQQAIVTSHRHYSLFLQFGERRGAKKFSEIRWNFSGAHNVRFHVGWNEFIARKDKTPSPANSSGTVLLCLTSVRLNSNIFDHRLNYAD